MLDEVQQRAALSKVTTRLIPFMFVLYVIAYLDRANAGFAALTMQKALAANDTAWGNALGVFFWGYFLLEIPSNLILERVGARRWIARIMITWGIIAAAMMFVTNVTWFSWMRVLLGMAEAGFFPGMILYLTYWFPTRERAKAVGLFMAATPVALAFGGPLSGQFLRLNGVLGLAGWQWLFLLEGLPAVVLGFVVLAYLPNGPQDAKWLTEAEREWITSRLAPDQAKNPHRHESLAGALTSWKVWLLCAIYLCSATGSYGYVLWLPKIVKGIYPIADWKVTLLVAVPYTAAAIGLIYIGRSSDRTGERKRHVAFPAFLAAVSLCAVAWLLGPGKNVAAPNVVALMSVGFLSLAAAGMWGVLAPFWTLPAAFLSGTAAAGGIALINSVGNLGGWVGPITVGKVRDVTHSFSGGMLALAIAYVLLGALTLSLHLPEQKESVAEALETVAEAEMV